MITQVVEENSKKVKRFFKPVAIMTFIYLVGICSILRANFNYIDDMRRVAQGYKGWDDFSRYLSVFLSNFIHADTYLTDVSPLPQTLAALGVALSGIIFLFVVTGKDRFTFWQYVALVPLGLSPYFLECISYKYDAPYMAFSVLASVTPLIFRNRKSMAFGIASGVGMLGVCMTYQAASGIFPMLVVFLATREWLKKEKTSKKVAEFLAVSIVGYGVGLIIFKLFIMHSTDTYVSTSIPKLSRVVPNTVEHLKHYYKMVMTDFKKEWLVFVALMCVAYVVAVMKESLRNKILAACVAALSLFAMALLAFGLYPVLEMPLDAPRAMYGFGIFIAIIAVEIASASKVYLGKVVCLILSWAFFVFSFTYGNALYVQKEYTDFRITMVVDDLNDLDIMNSGDMKDVQICGTIGYAPAIRNMPQDYQILNRLVPITFREHWAWGIYGFLTYYDIRNLQVDDSVDLSTMDLPVLKDTMYHTIRGDANHILIRLK